MRVFQAFRVARLVSLLSVLAVAAAGCTGMHRIPSPSVAPEASSPRIGAGDDVRVTLRDGRRLRFTVANVDTEGLVSRGGARYSLSDVAAVERREMNGTRSVFVAVGVVGSAVLLVMSAAIASLAENAR